MPRGEYERVRQYVVSMGPTEMVEFASRVTDHGLFFLYDQRNGCQFLDPSNLCRLHNLGIKPAECFWWPYHIFTNDENQAVLELRVFLDCCDGHEAYQGDPSYPQMIEEAAQHIGLDVIKKFREVYHGGGGTTRLIRQLESPTS
jgi:hypothetical protein